MTVRAQKYLEDCRTLPGDAALAYKLEGVRGVWDAVAARTIHRIIRTGHLLVFSQVLESAPDIAPPDGVVIRPIDGQDWDALGSIVSRRSLAQFGALLANGRLGLVAWRGAHPIGYGWIADRMGPDVSACPFALPADAAYLWDLYVVPHERSSGIGSALASARNRAARQRGFREGWRMISPTNAASLRTLAKSGADTRIVGELRYVKVLAKVRARFSPQPPPMTAD